MNDRPASETLLLLRGDYVELRSLCSQAEDDLKAAGQRKAEGEYALAKKIATTRTVLLDAGISRNEANDRAQDKAIDERYEVELALSAVRDAENAVRLLNHQLDTLQALGHFANREIKLEMAG